MSRDLQNRSKLSHPRWMSTTLWIAGVYNLAWGLFAVVFPEALFRWAGMELPRYPELWQCIGMIVGVYGIGYAVAARDPLRHWPIVLVGLLGKIFGPIGFAMALVKGTLPIAFGATILTNDLVWWVPFSMILWHAFDQAQRPPLDEEPLELDEALRTIRSDQGLSLTELSENRPVMAVFLRHSGCTFCRETLADLQAARTRLAEAHVGLAIVHMSQACSVKDRAKAYQLDGTPLFSDPHCRLYRAFGLTRGSFRQLFGPRVWLRGVTAFLRGNGLGQLDGDGFQMPGVFIVDRGRVAAAYRHQTAGDRPDYEAMAAKYLTDNRTSHAAEATV